MVSLTAQDDEVLSVERRADLRGRDALLQRWSKIRVDIERAEITADELASVLSDATGGMPFLYVRRKAETDAVPPFALSLRRVSVPSLMGIVADKTDLVFVYRRGTVLLVPEDQFKPLTYLQVYDVRAATMPLRSFPGPRLGLPVPDGENFPFPEEEETSNTPCGFTADQLEDALRSHVTPDAWDDKATLTQARGLFMIKHTPAGHRQVQKLLAQLGAISPPRRIVLR